MRIILLTLAALGISACATLNREVVTDLAPVFGNVEAYEGRMFEGELYAIRHPATGVDLALSPDEGAVHIPVDQWARRRFYDYYQLQTGHSVRIRATIREERIIVTQAGGNGACQTYAGFYLANVQVLGIR